MNAAEKTIHSIFLADDNPENLEVLGTLLEGEGYEIRAARDGAQALASIRLDPPDIILLDIHMPKKDGYETCEELKKDPELKDIPVIFISALNETYNRLKGFEIGAADYISKPFQTPEVLARVRTQLDLKAKTDELRENLEVLSRYQDSLVRSETQANLGNLVASLAHEINTPLGNIILCHSQAKDLINRMKKLPDGELPEQVEALATLLEYGQSSLETLKGHVKQFKLLGLDFEESGHGRVDMMDIIENLRLFFPENSAVRIARINGKVKGELMWPFGLQSLLQILMSLIKNSVDHAGRPVEDVTIEIQCAQHDGFMVIDYRDNGNGIAEDILPRIYEPFVTSRRIDSFLGLGLHLVYLIVTKVCSGRIDYKGSDKGARFVMTIPVGN